MKITPIRFIAIFCVLILIHGCIPVRQGLGSMKVKKSFKKSVIFSNQFTGFLLFDPSTKEYLIEHNADLHFTPASNTKIFTTAACLSIFKDSIPTFKIKRDSTLSIYPLGDPTFLHPDFPNQPAIDKIHNRPINIFLPTTELPVFGPGWAWDDYQYSFQAERSWLPVYANEVRIFNTDTLHVIPPFFSDYVELYLGEKPGSFIHRDLNYNLFNVWMEHDSSKFERKIPFQYSNELLSTLLSDTTKAPVNISADDFSGAGYDIIYNQPTIPVLALMMQRSDNFLAEQLLITASRTSGYNNLNAFRNKLLELWGFSNNIQWVDGSGLSRYNLFTPRTLVKTLNQIFLATDWKNIQYIFPNGGKSGTIKDWYAGVNQPYVYAKTGTLSNNHCLSGFVVTNSGKKLIFSFMNNNYLTPVSEVKTEMQKVLETIRDSY